MAMIPEDEDRCIYVKDWVDKNGKERHSRCKRKKSRNSDYCLNHRKRLENDGTLAKPIKHARFEYDDETTSVLCREGKRDIPRKIIMMMEMGHSQTVAAYSLGINPALVTEWCRKACRLIEEGKTDHKMVKWYEEFLSAKYRAAGLVENALFKMAIQDHNFPAALKWLSMRVPEEWTEKREVTIDGMVQITNAFEQMSDEELRKAVQQQLAEAAQLIEVENLAE